MEALELEHKAQDNTDQQKQYEEAKEKELFKQRQR